MGEKIAIPGDYIHSRRRKLALTKGEAARLAGLTDGRWRDIEQSHRRPTDQELCAVARVLRVDAAVLQRRYG
jgi:transcriptional regulator with XRE-family HTH domain